MLREKLGFLVLCLVAGVVHLGCDVSRPPDRLGQLDDQVVVDLILVGGVALLRNPLLEHLVTQLLIPVSRCRGRGYDGVIPRFRLRVFQPSSPSVVGPLTAGHPRLLRHR